MIPNDPTMIPPMIPPREMGYGRMYLYSERDVIHDPTDPTTFSRSSSNAAYPFSRKRMRRQLSL